MPDFTLSGQKPQVTPRETKGWMKTGRRGSCSTTLEDSSILPQGSFLNADTPRPRSSLGADSSPGTAAVALGSRIGKRSPGTSC